MSLPTPYYEQDGIVIYHADCRDILPLIEPGSIDLVLTDPPYGVDFDTDFTRFTGGVSASFSTHAKVHDDDVDFDPALITNTFARAILFGANVFSDRLPTGSWIVWDKRSPGGSKNVMSDGEVAWKSWGHGVYIYAHTWDGFNRASERGTAHHPTQKPVSLMRWIVNKWSKHGDLILDPYMGSGPIAKACADTGRRYIGIELEERYCEIAAKRLQQSVLPMFAEAAS